MNGFELKEAARQDRGRHAIYFVMPRLRAPTEAETELIAKEETTAGVKTSQSRSTRHFTLESSAHTEIESKTRPTWVNGHFQPLSADLLPLTTPYHQMIVIQTTKQREILEECSSDDSCVLCLDSSFDIAAMKLSTLLVIGKNGEGLCVAWALHSNLDTLQYRLFLTLVKQRVPGFKAHQRFDVQCNGSLSRLL